MTLKANKLRVFLSLRNDAKECTKRIRSPSRALVSSHDTVQYDEDNPVSEYFIGPNLAPLRYLQFKNLFVTH